MFPTSARETDIYFHFPWVEQDDVSIDLPPGYLPENAEQPGSVTFGDAGTYQVSLDLTKDTKTLIYKRNFRFVVLMIPKGAYSNLKAIFGAIHESDNHTITLKQGAAAVKQ